MTLQQFKKITDYVMIYMMALILLVMLFNLSPIGRDSSDSNKSWGYGRSGLNIHRDKLTGCQYLSTADGGLTPRIIRGNQIFGCETVEKSK